jgi:predicted alpha/beta-hydrolase family hydrolase
MTYLFDGPPDGPLILALAHGAGAPMDSDFMRAIAAGLAAGGCRVARFEFAYMAARRENAAKRPPPAAPKLLEEWRAVAADLRRTHPRSHLAIGGKSLGGRMASLIADEIGAAGLVCLGYPFHPPGRPESLRTDHLRSIATPTLIVQGTRDPFGTREEVAGYALSPAIDLCWVDDGDHSLKPRKASGRSLAQNLEVAVLAIDRFLAGPAAH